MALFVRPPTVRIRRRQRRQLKITWYGKRPADPDPHDFLSVEKKDSCFTSRILPEVFAGLEERDNVCVLDVGVGVPSTLEFLARFQGRVLFLDLAPEGEAFESKLDEYAGTLFDVVLFWDFLHRLEPERLCALSAALRPYLYSQTLGYSVFNITAPDVGRFRIGAPDRVELAKCDAVHYQEFSQTEFVNRFDSFDIRQSLLRRDGYLELLLRAD